MICLHPLHTPRDRPQLPGGSEFDHVLYNSPSNTIHHYSLRLPWDSG